MLSTTSYKFDELCDMLATNPRKFIFLVECVENIQKDIYKSLFGK